MRAEAREREGEGNGRRGRERAEVILLIPAHPAERYEHEGRTVGNPLRYLITCLLGRL